MRPPEPRRGKRSSLSPSSARGRVGLHRQWRPPAFVNERPRLVLTCDVASKVCGGRVAERG